MTMPPGAQRIATNDHCEVAGMTLGDHILTFQGHPEFIPEYSKEIMSFRYEMIGVERVAEGMASFESRQHEGDAWRAGCWPSRALSVTTANILHRFPRLLQRQRFTGLQ